MRLPTPEHIKSGIIDAWMTGKTRDKIASEFNISTGSVSNIIEQWQDRIGVFDATNLRELALALKKAGISPVQCVDGLRTSNITNQLAIDKDHLFDFLKKLYNECKEQRLPPADIARLVKVINDYPEINSLNEIPKTIKKRRQEKIKLYTDIYYRKLEIQKLDHEIERKSKERQDIQDGLESFRNEIKDEKKDFLLFNDAKDELKKHDIPIHLLEPLIDVIRIFNDMHFRPLTILSKFSDINAYRDRVENKNWELKELESHIENLKEIFDNYEKKISSKEEIVQSLNQLDNLGFNASDIKNLETAFSEISQKYGLNKKEIQIGFFRYLNSFNTLLSIQQEILEKTNNLSMLDREISSRRKVIESQPIVFAILQYLVNGGLNEHDFRKAFKIFKTDLYNNMPYGDRTYLERLSKDLDKYRTVRDTLAGLNNKILLKESHIGKLALVRSNLEAFLFSLVFIIYFYSILLNVREVQILKSLIKRIPLVCVLNYGLLPHFFFIVINGPKKSVRSRFKKQENNHNNNNKKSREVKKNKNNNDKTIKTA
jgi:hypothetical protein